MTIRVPDDLADLRALAADLGGAPAIVIREPATGEEWDGLELPILQAEVNEDHGCIQVHTAVPAAGPSPRGGLTFSALLAQLESLAAPGQSRELFWVSSLRPLAPETDPELSRYSVRAGAAACRSHGERGSGPRGVPSAGQWGSAASHRLRRACSGRALRAPSAARSCPRWRTADHRIQQCGHFARS